MIASGAMRDPRPGGRAGLSGEWCTDRVSSVDSEFCCLRLGTLLARARQAKGRAQNAAERSGGQASRPVVAALSGPGGARLEDVEKLVRRTLEGVAHLPRLGLRSLGLHRGQT
jgi:hypothetical protein